MIVGERKSLSEIKDMVRPYGKVLVAGCDTCTAECMAGGRKQVAELAAALDMSFRLEGKEMEVQETSVDRQCIHEFLLDVIEQAENCGDCILGATAGLCPVTRCAKSLLNGPCGGSQNGLCEVSVVLKCDVPCVWAMIYERLQQMGELDRLTDYCPPKDWRPGGAMGPRQMVREH
ncbi:MAG: methylenetetrahydrofolate reductase C-terminal domain-containing protein [Deltaproteobacteria bacterium]|nr:methylenetetrahydrofolate reductase C-terminal domain-containing protein [Deltaproteobacteria bacterium]